jgi:hypothetical protein
LKRIYNGDKERGGGESEIVRAIERQRVDLLMEVNKLVLRRCNSPRVECKLVLDPGERRKE